MANVWRVAAKAGRITGWLSVYMLVLDALHASLWSTRPMFRLIFVLGVSLGYAVLAEMCVAAQGLWERHADPSRR